MRPPQAYWAAVVRLPRHQLNFTSATVPNAITMAHAMAVLAALLWLGGCTGLVSGTSNSTTLTANLLASTNTLNFGQIPVGSNSSSQSLTLTNSGSSAITVNSLKTSGPFAVSGFTGAITLNGSQSLPLSVTFAPSAPGAASGSLSITSSASSNAMSISLSGTGEAPVISVNPSSLTFGSQTVGTTSKSQSVTVSNQGQLSLSLNQIVSPTAFVMTGPTAPVSISPGSSVTYAASFDPKAAQSYTGSMMFVSDAFNGNASTSVSGTGVVATPVLSISPASLSFGNETVNTVSAPQTLTLSNTGNAALTISAVQTSAGFSVSSFTGSITLNPNQNLQVSVTFAPTSQSSYNGSLTITSTAPSSPNTVGLTGSGVAITTVLNVSPGSLSFGNQVVSTSSAAQGVTLANGGSTAITISAVQASAGFSVNGFNTSTTLNAGQTLQLTVIFAPTSQTSYSGTLTITSSAPSSPNTVGLTGTGVAAVTALSVSPGSLSFGNQVVNSTSPGRTVTLKNTGNTVITVSAVQASTGFGASGFTTSTTLNPGQSLPLAVTFAPTTQASFTGTLTITSTAPSSPNIVTLSGTGIAQQTGVPLCGGPDDALIHWPNTTIPNDWETFTPPSTAGGTYVDRLGSILGGTGCTVTRLTIDGAHNYYSATEAMSATDTYVFVEGGIAGGGGWKVVDLHGNLIVDTPHMPNKNAGLYEWDATNGSKFYYTLNNTLYTGTITGTNSVTTAAVHTFIEYTYVTVQDETGFSYDNDHLSLTGEVPANSNGIAVFDIFSYSISGNSKSYIFRTATNGCMISGLAPGTGVDPGTQPGGDCIHKVIMSTDNRTIIEWHLTGCEGSTCAGTDPNVAGGGSSGPCASDYNHEDCKTIINADGSLTAVMHGTIHMDSLTDITGTKSLMLQIYLPPFANPLDPCWNNLGHSLENLNLPLQSAGMSCLFSTNSAGGHISAHASGPRQPWALIDIEDGRAPNGANPEMYNNSSNFVDPGPCGPNGGAPNYNQGCWINYQDEIILIRIDSTGKTNGFGISSGSAYRLAWARSRTGQGFWVQTKASLSRSGRYVVFSSNMAWPNGGCNTSPSDGCPDVYMIGPLF